MTQLDQQAMINQTTHSVMTDLGLNSSQPQPSSLVDCSPEEEKKGSDNKSEWDEEDAVSDGSMPSLEEQKVT